MSITGSSSTTESVPHIRNATSIYQTGLRLDWTGLRLAQTGSDWLRLDSDWTGLDWTASFQYDEQGTAAATANAYATTTVANATTTDV